MPSRCISTVITDAIAQRSGDFSSRIGIHSQTALARWFGEFDRVYCISLPRSLDRREWIAQHLNDFGVSNYEIFNATDREDPEVARFYAGDLVARYPNCFRCGALSCGSDDCNNVLIEPQVATFISYLRLWRHIVDEGLGRVLIFEDDVRLQAYAEEVAVKLLSSDYLARAKFDAYHARILRLGWARCGEHDASSAFVIRDDAIRMSNPLHAITNAYARKLLERFERINTTVDVYQHDDIPPGATGVTVFPPMADELSWSEGAVESLIHPKPNRLEFLRQHAPKDSQAISAAKEKLEQHFSHIYFRPLYLATLGDEDTHQVAGDLEAMNIDVTAHVLTPSGLVGWRALDASEPLAIHNTDRAIGRSGCRFGVRVHWVQDPRRGIAQLIAERQGASFEYTFRRKYMRYVFKLDLDSFDPLEGAALTWFAWHSLIEAEGIDLRLRAEDGFDALNTPLSHYDIELPPRGSPSGQSCGASTIDDSIICARVSPPVLVPLNALAEQYGYAGFTN